MKLRERRRSSNTWTQADNDAPAAASSGSEFDAAEAAAEAAATAADDYDEMEEDELDEDDLVENIPSAAPADTSFLFPSRRGPKAKANPGRAALKDMRYRPSTVFQRQGKLEHLSIEPRPFATPTVHLSTSAAASVDAINRISRVTGNSVGAGPPWSLIADFAWWKESQPPPSLEWTENVLRPFVHQNAQFSDTWKLLDDEASSRYLPAEDETTDSAPYPVKCLIGPFESQEGVNFLPLQTVNMSRYFPEGHSFVFNAGTPVFALDWCPIAASKPNLPRPRYLAVAPLPSRSYKLSIGNRIPSAACIQIWRLHSNDTSSDPILSCDLLLCIDQGPAMHVKWCPLPGNTAGKLSLRGALGRLGLLAGTFADGSLSVFGVPEPSTWPARPGKPTAVYTRPLARLALDNTSCWCFDWANSDTIAVGCTNGSIVVVKITATLAQRKPNEIAELIPTHYFSVHQSAVRSVAWLRLPPTPAGQPATGVDPTTLVSGGHDGRVCIIDIRDPRPALLNRSRDIILDICFSPQMGQPIAPDGGNLAKLYSMSPAVLGHGQTVIETEGPIWSLAASDYHAHLAIGCADGSLFTTNLSRPTKRMRSAPFFCHRIFQLEYSPSSGTYRMLEHFQPRGHVLNAHADGVATKDRKGKKKQAADDEEMEVDAEADPDEEGPEVANDEGTNTASGAWPKQVTVTCTAWDSGGGLANAPFLASATASGLCRIDWLPGRFYDERITHETVRALRTGTTKPMEKDEDEDDDE